MNINHLTIVLHWVFLYKNQRTNKHWLTRIIKSIRSKTRYDERVLYATLVNNFSNVLKVSALLITLFSTRSFARNLKKYYFHWKRRHFVFLNKQRLNIFLKLKSLFHFRTFKIINGRLINFIMDCSLIFSVQIIQILDNR